MSKFNVGDKVWYFFSEWDDVIKFSDISLKITIIDNSKMAEAYNDAAEGLYHKTKRQALNSMSKRLKEFLDDNEIN